MKANQDVMQLCVLVAVRLLVGFRVPAETVPELGTVFSEGRLHHLSLGLAVCARVRGATRLPLGLLSVRGRLWQLPGVSPGRGQGLDQ